MVTAADDFAEFYVHVAAVSTRQGANALGDDFASSVDLACFASIVRHMVRDATGQEVVAQTRLTTRKENFPAFTPGSKVTVLGRTSTVITAKLADSGDLGLPDHCTVSLA